MKPSVTPPPFPLPWSARVTQTHRWRYELAITAGCLRHGWQGDGFGYIHAWGSRERAERKAKRIVDRLNRREALERQRAANATEVC